MNKNKPRYKHVNHKLENVRELKVNKEDTLLNFLYAALKDQSRNSVKSLLENNRILVNGSPTTQYDYRLVAGDIVMIANEPIHRKQRSNLPIIYEDNEIIVINKPSGLLSVASDKEKGSTAYRMLSEYVQQKDKHNRIYIVHRLDEDTSGVFMVSKSFELKEALQNDWNNLVKKRGYYAMVEGTLKQKEGTIKTYLKKNSLNLMYSVPKSNDAQLAITHYKVMQENEDYSLLDVNIDTGRKNQIRVHLGERGHHIIGDDKYGNPKNPIGRLGLHAYELDLIHPFTKKLMKFKCPMPDEFQQLMDGTFVMKKPKNKKK